jgi:hypothetical protein
VASSVGTDLKSQATAISKWEHDREAWNLPPRPTRALARYPVQALPDEPEGTRAASRPSQTAAQG